MWVVEFDDSIYGPFVDESACYDFAAQVSREANDWTPVLLSDPDLAIEWAKEA